VSKPKVTFPDPEIVVKDVLVATEGAIVSMDYPSAPLTGTNKKIQVSHEGSDSSDYPMVERASVRVTFHTAPNKRSDVKSYASSCLAKLANYRGSSTVAAFVPLIGRSAVSIDPDTGNHMCWVLIRVDMKATIAS